MFNDDDDDYLEYLYVMGDEDNRDELETWFGKAGANRIIERNTGRKERRIGAAELRIEGKLENLLFLSVTTIAVLVMLGLIAATEKGISFSNEHRNPYEGYSEDYKNISENHKEAIVHSSTITCKGDKTFGKSVNHKRKYYFDNDGIYCLEMTVDQGKDSVDKVFQIVLNDYNVYFGYASEQKQWEGAVAEWYSWELEEKGKVDLYVYDKYFRIVITSTDLDWIENLTPEKRPGIMY